MIRTVFKGCIPCCCWSNNWISTHKGVSFVFRMFTKKEYNKPWIYHISPWTNTTLFLVVNTYDNTIQRNISLKGMRSHILWNHLQHPSHFNICLSSYFTYNQILPKAFCSYKIKQWKWFCEYIFYDSYHYLEIGIAHFRRDTGISAFSFWKCRNLLQRVFSFLIKCNE